MALSDKLFDAHVLGVNVACEQKTLHIVQLLKLYAPIAKLLFAEHLDRRHLSIAMN